MSEGCSFFWARFVALLVVGVLACRTTASCAGLLYTGVNLSGAEFGQANLPGTFGADYTYPTNGEVDYYVGKGMNTFRLPFRWERLQPSQNAPLDTTELGRIDAFVNYATSQGAFTIIEPHNFARYFPQPPSSFQNSTTGVVGSDVPNAAFANFWSQVANHYKNNSHVIFNLMNEPANVDTDTWVASANAAIAAIRTTGATNVIQVPGNRFTGAWTWDTSGNSSGTGRSNAEAMLNIVDPGNNFSIEVHQYLDTDGSGTSTMIANDDVDIGVLRLTFFTRWLHEHNLKGFLGEFAVANVQIGTSADQIGDETLMNMLNYLNTNSDVWTGWTWWGGGPWWDGSQANPNATPYLFLLDPANLTTPTDRAAMAVLQPYLVGVPEPSALVLFVAGLICLSLLCRRRTGETSGAWE